MSGLPSLIAGVLGPLVAPLTDIWGSRSLILAGSLIPSITAFILLATTVEAWAVYAYVGLTSITYGIGDTVAFISIRMIVGADRVSKFPFVCVCCVCVMCCILFSLLHFQAGKAYALYCLVGNLYAFAVPTVGGVLVL